MTDYGVKYEEVLANIKEMGARGGASRNGTAIFYSGNEGTINILQKNVETNIRTITIQYLTPKLADIWIKMPHSKHILIVGRLQVKEG